MIDVPAFMTQDEIVHVPTVANLDPHPGKAKRESCKKKAHNDGHVPHKRKRNYPAQKVVQQMVEQVGTGGYWWVLVGTGGYWRVLAMLWDVFEAHRMKVRQHIYL